MILQKLLRNNYLNPRKFLRQIPIFQSSFKIVSSYRSFSTDTNNQQDIDEEQINGFINGNVYQGPCTPISINHGEGYLVYDAHISALKSANYQLAKLIFALSLCGDYYFYYMAFNSTYFGISLATSLIFGSGNFLKLLNASVVVYEVIILPSKDRVLLRTLKGTTHQASLNDVKLKSYDSKRGVYTIVVINHEGRKIALSVVSQTYNQQAYFNKEAFLALINPQVEKFA